MRTRPVGFVLALAFLVGCGASRPEQETAAARATETANDAASCPVELQNPTPYDLTVSQAVPGVDGTIRIGEVERLGGTLRFVARCALGTVRIQGYAGRTFAAWGSAALEEGRLTRLELERTSRAVQRRGYP